MIKDVKTAFVPFVSFVVHNKGLSDMKDVKTAFVPFVVIKQTAEFDAFK